MAVGYAGEARTDAVGHWMYVLKEVGAAITGYEGDPCQELIIPSQLDGYPVMGIENGVFFDRYDLTGSAIIPEGVTYIGDWAFAGSGFHSVTLPNSVTSIGDGAFDTCENIKRFIIPGSVEDIGTDAFANCDSLILIAAAGSAAERYAVKKGIPYIYDSDPADAAESGRYKAPERRMGALADMVVYKNWDTSNHWDYGIALNVLQTPEGTLLTGVSDYGSDGWMALLDQGGNEVWSVLGEEYKQLYQYPVALPGGKFAVLRYTFGDELSGGPYKSLRILRRDGTVILDVPVSVFDGGMALAGDTLFIVGNAEIGRGESAEPQAGPPVLSWLDMGGEEVRSQTIDHGYAALRPAQVMYAENSLLVGASANTADTETAIGVLMRIDLNGNVIWSAEFTPKNGSGRYLHDICVSEDGVIAIACAEYGNDPYDGRWCDVYGLSMDGKVLWNYKTGDARVDYILSVKGGFLCVSQGLNYDNCPFLGNGWVLLLDSSGNIKAPDSVPDIGDRNVEVYGVAGGVNGEALLCGTVLMDSGSPDNPFYATLDFPAAYYAQAAK